MQRAGSGKDDSQQRTPSASQPQAISQLILGHAVQTGAASTQPTNTTLLAPLHSVPAPSPSVAAPMLAPSFTLTAPVPRGLAGVAPYYASATPTGVGILSKPPPNCFITASPTSITRARVQPGLTGGLVAVPPVGQTRKPQHPSPQSSSPRPVPHSLLVVQQVAAPELQMARPQAGGMASLAPLTSASATGGTIHHLGHSPPRGGMPPLANPTMVPHMSSGQPNPPFIQMSPGVLPRRDSTSATGSPSVPGLVSLQYPIIKSPVQSPERPRKKVKVEEKPPATPEIGTWRKVVQEQKIKELRELKENYNEHLTELFFLQNGGNIMDYYTWKKRPTVQLVQFLKSGNLDSDDEDIPQEKKINDEVKVLMTSGGTTPLATPIAISTTLPAAITAMQQQGIDQSRKPGGRHGMVFAHAPPQMSVSQAPASQPSTPVGTPTTGRPTVAQILKSASSSSSNVAASTTLHAHLTEATVTPTTAAQKTPVVSSAAGTVKTLKTPTSSQKSPRPGAGSALDSTIGSQEAIVERAKQEAQVMQRIAELRKNGMWSARRLPKVQEPPRNKAHWDYLLEEMQWLAADFAQERKWKKAGARKIARMISKHFQEQQQKELRAEKEEVMKLKRIASQMARQIKEFWQNIEKVVQFKQQSRLEEKKKRALDLHLSFIVDQTEKYSSWLTEGLGTRSTTSSVYSGSQATSPAPDADQEDGDFEPVKDESDDEETIEKEEQETDLNEESTRNEIDALQRESEMPIEELLQSLPPEVLEKPAPLDLPEEDDGQEAGDEDEEFRSSDEEAEDDEETLEEEEKQERTVDHSQEISELQQEGEMPMEELLQKYAGAYDSDFEAELSAQSTETEEDSDDIPTDYEDEEDEEADDEEEEIDVEGEDDVGMECLFDTEKQKKGDGSEPGHEITDIAAAAQSLQPTGYTLETTQVKTPVPFLLKHTLREYQHVGLDWLATMYDRRLNGILADEMGLGKTIQTIALLAHLACEKGVWGPHLIVVPTSVMLNWEMEIKKWCPAFKILTYYGTQKERKQKRQGWTKTNAFHVCITSYKLVIQDHQSFRRKKWKYFILDEAQNIKNFKSQRWQTLLNFSSQRRLLLTGTPLQNNLMELWSLMHFLMPHVFQSHREFKEWFSNPLSGMIEGSREYNESLIRRLHKVLRPFLLRRLKHDVEKQLPKKYEHVVMCRLSKRQRFLYDDFMSQAKTKETLATGHFMSVINILMQLRKVCNHPNLFDPRPTVSPFQMEGITYSTASAVLRALEKDPVEYIDPSSLYPCLADLELKLPAFAAHRIRKLQTPKPLIDEIDSTPEPPPRPEPLKKPLSVVFRNLSSALQSTELSNQQQTGRGSPLVETGRMSPAVLTKSSTPVPTSRSTASTPSTPQISTQQPKTPAASSIVTSAVLSRALSTPVQVTTPAPSAVTGTPIEQLPGYKPTIQSKLQVQQRAATVTQVTTTPVTATPVSSVAQQMISSQPITLHLQQTEQGTRLLIPSGQLAQLPAGLLSIVQTPGGQQIITTQPVSQSQAQVSRPINGPVPVSRPPITTTASSTAVVMTTTAATVQVAPSVSRTPQAVQLPTSAITVAPSKPVMRVAPLTTTTASASCQLSSALSTSAVGSSPLSSSHTSTASVHASTPTGHVTRSRTKLEKSLEPEKKSPFFLQSLEDKRRDWREECLRRLIYLNKRNCDIRPVYGQDLCGAVDILKQKMPSHHTGLWKGQGYIHCCKAQHPALFNPNLSHHYWTQTRGLVDMVHTPEELLASMKDILDRFQFVTPAVTAPRTCLHASHPPPEHLSHQRVLEYMLHKEVSPKAACLHRISTNMSVQFPELRLIQYDCGKLQTLDILLRRLKSGQHRVLIFTQMTKMLDVMEQFLSFHGYRYLRLDGTTRVEQRQALMDRFNMDKRIFVFILSTRSGGIGVNLTGADTVIFYDSDWNPTMDAQAQDRCHRIGQTRDVHIYRLISEKTIEENILKKANQKRLLGNVAIEGGNFTTAFFKEQTIQELFEEPSGLEALAKEKEREELAKQVKEIKEKPVSTRSKRRSPTPAEPGKLTEEQMELALCNAEDETDVQAARVARAEQKAELAEFDEDIPWDEREEQQRKEREEEMSKVEQELLMLEKELTPVERYAVCYMESVLEPECTEELELAEKEVEIAKEEWELGRLKALKEEEERRAAFEEDEMLFTYTRDDAYNQIFVCDETGEHMPLWAPPTPPQDDNDLYIDQTVHFMYDPSVMTESQLPPVYIKKEHKKIKIENVRKHKGRKDEQVRVPRSLFDRPSAALVKLRREAKLAKMNKGIFRAPTGLKLPTVPNTLESSSDQADWFIHEDWALLQAVQMLMDVPLNLMIISPAHIPNWDLVADVVNGVSRVYRSAKQCKNRYESVIIPREEGRILYDINPRKQKKNKGIYKTKNNRPMKTSQINLQDNNHHVTNLFTLRFDSVKSLVSRRSPTLRPTLANPSSKNPKHVAVLTDSGITYDQPMTPIQVAKIRAERIAREKKQNQQAVAEQRAAQLAQQQQQQQAGAQTVVTVAGSTAIAGVTTAMQGTATTILTGGLPKASLTGGATAVSIPRTLSPGSIVVNTASPVVSAALTQAIRTTRTAAGQEITAVVANPVTAQTPGRVTTVSGAQVITTTFNTAQLLAAQRAVSSGTTTTVAGQTLGIKTTGAVQQQLMQAKSLTPHQLSMFKTQQILKRQQTQQIQQARLATLTPAQAEQLKQQQQLKRLQAQGASVVGTVQKTVAVTTPLLTSVSQAATVAQTARLQAAKGTTLKHTTVARQMTREDMAALIKQQTALQHKTGSTQIFAQAQVQAVQQGTSSTPQVATLVKTVSTPGSVPSVTIPVSAVSVSGMNVSISLPQQKTTTGKMTTGTTQVRHQLQLQQLAQQRKSALHQQKVATLTQSQVQQLSKSQLGTQLGAVQIIPQQPKLTPTMIQQLVKQQTGSGQTAPTIQQIITSVTQAASSTATVITTPIVTQAASPSHKVSLPAGIVTTSLGQASRTGSVIGVTNVATSAANTTVTSTGTTQTVTVTIANSPVTNASGVTHGQTLMKPIQELVVSPAKALPTSSAVAQHLKTVSRPAQMVTISQGHQVQVKGSTMSVQQVVQQVQAQAQAQQAAQQRITTIPVTAAAASASPSVTVTQAAVSQSAQSTPQSVTQVSISTTTAQGTPQQQQAHAQAQARGTPYSMRLRNK